MRKDMVLKKIDQDDILEIVIEHYLNEELKNFPHAKALLQGKVGEDLRMIIAFSKKEKNDFKYIDLVKMDSEMEYNGDHSIVKNNHSFELSSYVVENKE